ncbi:MAG: lamin tail domain-containing protein [Chloroflexota bacterium]
MMKRNVLVCLFCLPLWLSLLVPMGHAQAAVVLLTEVMYNAAGDDAAEEWIELANVGTAVVDLSQYKVGDEETAGGGEGMARFPADAVLEPGQVVVVAQTAVGFRARYGRNPDYELQDSDTAVPDMRRFSAWASGDIGLANDGDELLLLNDKGLLIDALSYGDSTVYFDPAIASVFAGQSISRVPADCDTDSAADWQPQQIPTPGELSFDGECAAPLVVAETLPTIGEIQGRRDVAALVNEIVTFRGVVTGVLEDQNADGFVFYTVFVQDVPGQEDGDPATSDGIALFLGEKRPTLHPGDQLRITGQVTEFFGFTEIDDAGLELQLEATDVSLPPPIPLETATSLEAVEAMRVRLGDDVLVAGPTFSGCGFAVVMGEGERPFRRQVSDPIDAIVPILYRSDVDCGDFPQVKSGDRVSGLVGPLAYHFDQFKIVQQEGGDLVVSTAPLSPLPPVPTLAAAQFSVATFNMENYFDGVDDTGTDAEPKLSPTALATKQAKLAYALAHTLGCPTLVGVQEVENDALLQALAAQTTARCGFTYAVTHRESADVRGIDVALLSDPRRVTILNVQLQQACTALVTGIVDETAVCPAGTEPLFSRPPLQVDVLIDGQPLTLFVNHFKSKLGGEEETGVRRLAQAQHLNTFVAALLAADPQARVVVMGDFNDYEQSPPLLALSAQMENVLLRLPDATRYSYVYGGVAQLIDGLFVTPALAAQVVDVAILHVNADYPQVWGEDTRAEWLAYRATDHDLPLVVFQGVAMETAVTPSPTAAPTPMPQPTMTPSPAIAEKNATVWWLGGALLLGLSGGIAVLRLRRRT